MQDPREAHPKPSFEGVKEQSFPGLAKDLEGSPIHIDYGEDSYIGRARLNGKKAIVTGADSGIGRAVALAFAREGADVAIQYLPSEEADAEETRKLIEGAGRTCVMIPSDFTEGQAACARVVDAAVDKFGRVDVLVNNASMQGKAVEGGLEEMSFERIRTTFVTNILPYFEVTRCALKHMSPGSSIVNMASTQAFTPSGGIIDYAASKGAMVTLTKGLGLDFAASCGIRVNAVAPGPVWTPLVAASFPEDKLKAFGAQNTPMGRPAQPKELAPAYVFLCSQDASYISGEVMAVTGGVPAGA